MVAPRLILILLLVACAWFNPALWGFSESPDLRQRVDAGKLPALEKRLPTAPVIITPLEKPGIYGGTWRMVLAGTDDVGLVSRSLAYENLVRWDPNWTRVLPNVASSWTINDDATVYRFRLRQGMHWSDGEPYTARDIVAWVDDVARNVELSPVPPAWLVVGGRLPECTAPDDLTVEFRFASPNSLFIEQLAGMRANELTHYPAHHFRKVHLQHNPQGASDLMQRTGLPWAAAFRTIYTPWTWRNAGIPTLDAWVIQKGYTKEATSLVAVRNPYFWKVDTLGRQLPYLDQVKFEIVADNAEAFRRVLAGQADFQHDHAGKISANELTGPIRAVRVVPTIPNTIALFLNLTHQDPAMRTALGNLKVRIALSEAINRERIIQEVFDGLGKPWQIAPRPESPFTNRRLGEQYTVFAADHANRLLDEAGLSVRGPDGLRTLPDGRPFHLTLLVPGPGHRTWPMILARVKQDWLAVGVAMDWMLPSREDLTARVGQNQHDGLVWWSGGGFTPMLEPEYFVPVSFEQEFRVAYAVPWAKWFIDPTAVGAEEPPAPVKIQLGLFRQILKETNPLARSRLMAEILTIAADQFYVMGISLRTESTAIRTLGFRNVPSSHFDSWLYPDPGPFNPCQFYQEPVTSPAP